MSKNKVDWIPTGFDPMSVGFCPNKRAWNKEMKRLGVTDCPYPTNDGMVHYFARTKGHGHCCIVTIGKRCTDPLMILGLITHEVVHVWQFILEVMNEHEPSREFEAYSIQGLTMAIIDAYERTRGKLTK